MFSGRLYNWSEAVISFFRLGRMYTFFSSVPRREFYPRSIPEPIVRTLHCHLPQAFSRRDAFVLYMARNLGIAVFFGLHNNHVYVLFTWATAIKNSNFIQRLFHIYETTTTKPRDWNSFYLLRAGVGRGWQRGTEEMATRKAVKQFANVREIGVESHVFGSSSSSTTTITTSKQATIRYEALATQVAMGSKTP